MPETKRRAIVVVSAFGLACLLSVSTEAASRAASKTHLGTKASALIRMVTPTSPVVKGTTIEFYEAGTAGPFVMPDKTVLVVTDVIASNCTTTAGSYVASIRVASSGSWKIPIYFNTNVDGEQKEIHFTSGVVLTGVPQARVETFSVANLFIELLGYLVKNQ